MAATRLPRSLTGNKEIDQAITTLSAAVEPYLPQQVTTIAGVELASGSNTVNHRLQRALQGWRVTRLRAAAAVTLYEPTTGTDTLSLVLVASAACTVDLEVW